MEGKQNMQNHFVLRASKRVAALATTGLVAGSFAVLSTGTAHAATGPTDYTCTVLGGEQTFQADTDTNAPAKMVVGRKSKPLNVTSTVTIPGSLAGLMHAVGARTADGTALADSTVAGKKITTELAVPTTEVPAEGDLVVQASGVGKALAPMKAGPLKITAGDFVSTLHLYDEAGEELAGLSPQEVPCTAAPKVVDTVQVLKAGSKTTVKPSFMRKVNRLRTVSTVKANTAVKARGKVKVVVKRNGKQIRQKLVKVSPKGKAAAVFAKMPKKGNFVIISRYMGSPNVKASQQRVVRKLK